MWLLHYNSKQPAVTIRRLIYDGGVFRNGGIYFGNFSRDRRVNVESGFDGFNNSYRFAGGNGASNFWEFHENNVGDFTLGVVGNSHGPIF
jgi:hypothetical protein